MRSLSHELAPFARGLAAQGLERADAREGHEGEQQEDALETVEALGHGEELAAVDEQAVLQQRGQGEEHAAAGHVVGALELDGRAPAEQADGRRDALEGARGGATLRRLAIGCAALALGPPAGVAGGPGSVFFLAPPSPRLCRRAAWMALLSVLASTPSRLAICASATPSSSSDWACASASGVSLLPRRGGGGA